MTKEFVLQVLENNGINQEYLNTNKGILINEEWFNVCEELVGDEVYDDYFDDTTNLIMIEFHSILKELGIEIIFS
jgi:hypothetical protein